MERRQDGRPSEKVDGLGVRATVLEEKVDGLGVRATVLEEKVDGLGVRATVLEEKVDGLAVELREQRREMREQSRDTKEGFEAMHRTMNRNVIAICGVFIAALVAWPG